MPLFYCLKAKFCLKNVHIYWGDLVLWRPITAVVLLYRMCISDVD